MSYGETHQSVHLSLSCSNDSSKYNGLVYQIAKPCTEWYAAGRLSKMSNFNVLANRADVYPESSRLAGLVLGLFFARAILRLRSNRLFSLLSGELSLFLPPVRGQELPYLSV
ncbi:MAG: hypothetical protein UX99_C0011G0012 [Candidatus Amesbacteria bacterium GW2011_GWB1_47_26]|nr:MAG: hypothetical protein UX52_C0013G0011 [Candidatus Amesbacteria bacterium GW2011_GWA1_46_35]KKU68594.1 MAG: hypothetical protein UX93_C0006G0011 [Microgenomates group bacterium GW2011_GWC1_47_20]KKU74556.1 MAG: hypothetical protein UX99_C0011G0012 [Candidatus Amesbacteria bacterium GW2011_GWB1_47_26]